MSGLSNSLRFSSRQPIVAGSRERAALERLDRATQADTHWYFIEEKTAMHAAQRRGESRCNLVAMLRRRLARIEGTARS